MLPYILLMKCLEFESSMSPKQIMWQPTWSCSLFFAFSLCVCVFLLSRVGFAHSFTLPQPFSLSLSNTQTHLSSHCVNNFNNTVHIVSVSVNCYFYYSIRQQMTFCPVLFVSRSRALSFFFPFGHLITSCAEQVFHFLLSFDSFDIKLCLTSVLECFHVSFVTSSLLWKIISFVSRLWNVNVINILSFVQTDTN